MHVKTKAIVLNSLKYGESQIIVDLLTEDVGACVFYAAYSKVVPVGYQQAIVSAAYYS